MTNSKLIRVLSVLRKEEIQAFESYLKRFCAALPQEVWLLFQLLKKQLAKKQQANFNKHDLFQKLYPKEEYHDGRMRKKMHELFEELENFIIESQRNRPLEREIYFLQFCRSHYLDKDYGDTLKDLQNKLADYPLQDVNYWETKTQFEIYKSYEIASSYNFKENMNIPTIIQHQTICFFIHQLKWHFFLLGNQNLALNITIPSFFYQILQEIEQNPSFLEVFLIEVYYYGVQMLLKNEHSFAAFQKLRQLVLQQSPLLSITEWTNLAVSIRNYIMMEERQNIGYEHIVFDLYMEHLKLGLSFSNNHLPPQSFINIIKMGTSAQKLAEVELFIAEYQHHLPEEIKENMLSLANAYLLFGAEEYQNALKILSILEKFSYYIFEINVRMLKIQSLYHLTEVEACINELNAFNVFLSRNDKLNEARKEKYRNFVKFLHKYCQLHPPKMEDKRVLSEKLENHSAIAYKNWLKSLLK
jgi:hypothetical protein